MKIYVQKQGLFFTYDKPESYLKNDNVKNMY